ncbi:unnamed protein product [Prunus armeniaca]
MYEEEVEKLINDRLRGLKISGDFEHALRREVDQANSMPFRELAYVFTKEYNSYRTIKKNPSHLFNLYKKSDESL